MNYPGRYAVYAGYNYDHNSSGLDEERARVATLEEAEKIAQKLSKRYDYAQIHDLLRDIQTRKEP